MIILFIYLIVLLGVSFYDYNFLHVRLVDVLILFLIALIYGIYSGSYLQIIAYILIMVMVFGLPALYNLGLGDLLIFISLAPMLIEGSIIYYLLIFFNSWWIWHIVIVNKKVIHGDLKNIRESLNKKNIVNLVYPLVPVIFISFLLWLFLQYILLS